MPDTVAAAGAGLVAEQNDLRLRQLDAGRAGRDRRVQVEIFANLFGERHLDFTERDGDAERRGAVRHAHRIVNLAGNIVAALLRVQHGVDGQQRRFGLNVMDVLRIADAGIFHGGFHRGGDLIHHRRAADVFGQQFGAHGGADREPRLRLGSGLADDRDDLVGRDLAFGDAGLQP